MAIVDEEDVPKHFDIAFIDADIIKYTAGFAAERTKYHLYEDGRLVESFDKHAEMKSYLQELEEFLMVDVSGYTYEKEKIVGEEKHATDSCDLIVKSLKEDVSSDKYIWYLSGNGNFRDKVGTLEKYGGNREGTPKPHWINSVTDRLKTCHGAKVVNGVEGDDAIGVGLTQSLRKGLKAIHIGCDKDVLYGIEGWHYNFKRGDFLYTTYEEAIRFKYIQGISGDKIDGYSGIPRIGIKKAEKILKDCSTEREMYESAVQAYRDYFGEEYQYTSWDGVEMVKTPEELFKENMTLGWIMMEKGKTWEEPVADVFRLEERHESE